MRARPGCGAPGTPGTPDSTGPSSPETGTARLPFRVGPTRRPGSSDIAARDRVVLSDHDLAVIAKAVARARQDGKNAAGGSPAPARAGPLKSPGARRRRPR